MGFACEEDARRVLAVLPKRFEKHGLTIHPDKTRLVSFERPDRASKRTPSQERGNAPGHLTCWGSRTSGAVAERELGGETEDVAESIQPGAGSLSQWCRQNRHLPIAEQHHTLCQKLTGHFGYYGITGNSVALSRFRHEAIHVWRRWLSRRERDGDIPWEKFTRLLARYPLPPPIAIHSVCRLAASS